MSLVKHLIASEDHTPLPHHGGRLLAAAKESEIPLEDWLDLSTGINPAGWSPGHIPASHFSRLPENHSALEDAARSYYFGRTAETPNSQILAIPGSQWFIQAFPRLVSQMSSEQESLSIMVPDIGYTEHAWWWQYHGHQTLSYQESLISHCLSQTLNADVIVIINPNNPSASMTLNTAILSAAQHNPDTLFVIDEAFIDTQPEKSVLGLHSLANMIVLRSLGKFFGLAGLRVGFCFAHPQIGKKLRTELGPWPIATTSEQLAIQALKDTQWQQNSIKWLQHASGQMKDILNAYFRRSNRYKPAIISRTDLFVTLRFATADNAHRFYRVMKSQGVLLRYIEETSLIRVGLIEENRIPTFVQRLNAIS